MTQNSKGSTVIGGDIALPTVQKLMMIHVMESFAMLKMKDASMEFANVIKHARANIALLEAIVTGKTVSVNVRRQ